MQNLGTDGLLLIDSLSGRYNPYIDNAEAAKWQASSWRLA